MQQATHAGQTGVTHGSPERSGRQIAGSFLEFDLAGEAAQLRKEPNWQRQGHDAKTLVKEQGLRLVLVSLRRGAAMDEHQAPGPVAIQVLNGAIDVAVGGRTVSMQAGQMVALEAGIPHTVRATAESDVLLTLAGATYAGPTPGEARA